MKHLCQGNKCHTYDTQSRIRGTKGNKVLRTRLARYDIEDSYFQENRNWLNTWEFYFCDERCMNDWLKQHLDNLMLSVGIKTKPSETPIDVIKETKTGWRGEYIDTKIVVRA
jgi:hypothetical protein